jgi:SnoaL-like domain
MEITPLGNRFAGCEILESLNSTPSTSHGSEKDRPMSPREVVEEWVRRFNRCDATAIAELYHEDAVNHQVTQQPVEGRAAIREMFERDFAAAEITCIPEVIHEAGDGNPRMARSVRPARVRLLRRPRWPHCLPAGLLGQTFIS